MTKTLTDEQRVKMLKEKYRGIFPLEFTEGKKQEGAQAIPDTIQLIPVGQWDHDLYGPILITASDIREFIQNFNAGIRKGVFITAGHEGFEELPANGWITKVEARDDGLWGAVEWNKLGAQTLSDKQYKFFSPEFYRDYEDPQTHQVYRNVLVGGALTKSPYFKELEAIVFSEAKLKKQFSNNQTMNLQDLLAKDISTLSDAEIAFIKQNADKLTEAQKVSHTAIIDAPETPEEKEAREAKEKSDKDAADAKAKADTEAANIAAGLNADGSKITASDKGGKMIQMSETEANMLRQKANEGAQAFAELNKAKLDTAVKALIFSDSNKAGKFLPKGEAKLRAFMDTLSATQRTSFTEVLNELPKTQVFNEIGTGTGAADGTAQAEVNAKIEAKMKTDPKMKYSDALKAVMSENSGLEERYDSELPSARKSVKA